MVQTSTHSSSHAALIIDTHTTQCFYPKGPFAKATAYYDAKNAIYGLKCEVAVTACPPYFYTHVSAYVPGATHDFELFKRGYFNYLDYLLKLPTESIRLPGDTQPRHWALLCDLGYIGPEGVSPDV